MNSKILSDLQEKLNDAVMLEKIRKYKIAPRKNERTNQNFEKDLLNKINKIQLVIEAKRKEEARIAAEKAKEEARKAEEAARKAAKEAEDEAARKAAEKEAARLAEEARKAEEEAARKAEEERIAADKLATKLEAERREREIKNISTAVSSAIAISKYNEDDRKRKETAEKERLAAEEAAEKARLEAEKAEADEKARKEQAEADEKARKKQAEEEAERKRVEDIEKYKKGLATTLSAGISISKREYDLEVEGLERDAKIKRLAEEAEEAETGKRKEKLIEELKKLQEEERLRKEKVEADEKARKEQEAERKRIEEIEKYKEGLATALSAGIAISKQEYDLEVERLKKEAEDKRLAEEAERLAKEEAERLADDAKEEAERLAAAAEERKRKEEAAAAEERKRKEEAAAAEAEAKRLEEAEAERKRKEDEINRQKELQKNIATSIGIALAIQQKNKNVEPEPEPEPEDIDIDAIAAAISGLLLALYKQSTNEKSDMEEEVYGDIVEEEEKVIDDHLHKLCKNTFYETFKQPSRIEGMPYKTPIYVSHDNEYCYGTLISKEIVEDKYIDKSVEQLKCPFNKPYTVGSNKEEYKIDGEECSITKPKKEKEKPIVKPKETDEEDTRESREIITKQNKGKKSKQTKEQDILKSVGIAVAMATDPNKRITRSMTKKVDTSQNTPEKAIATGVSAALAKSITVV